VRIKAIWNKEFVIKLVLKGKKKNSKTNWCSLGTVLNGIADTVGTA
jgi:hypothetical protein